MSAWGSAPGSGKENLISVKARFTSGTSPIIIRAMPQSLSKVILHIIFSTKDREPWLDSDVRPRMHAYLATVCRDLGAEELMEALKGLVSVGYVECESALQSVEELRAASMHINSGYTRDLKEAMDPNPRDQQKSRRVRRE